MHVLTVVAAAMAGLLLGQASLAAAQAPPAGGTWRLPAPTYGVGSALGVPFVASDGTRLVTDIYYPVDRDTGDRPDGGRFPVLLTQNPYSYLNPSSDAAVFAARGYIYVIEDVRGTQRSGGTYETLGDRQALDGAELVRWAARDIPQSDGKVGLIGGSYLGITQIMAVAAGGPDGPVKAIAPIEATDDTYREPGMTGGIPTRFSLTYSAAQLADYPPTGLPCTDCEGTPARPPDPWSLPALLYGRAQSAESNAVGLTVEAATGGPRTFAGGWWNQWGRSRDAAPALAASRVPVLLLSGSADIFPTVQFRLFSKLQSIAQGGSAAGPMDPHAPADPRYQVVFADFSHGDARIGSLEGLGAQTEVMRALLLAWYDTWLKGRDTGLQRIKNPVHIMDEARGVWTNLPSYPVTGDYTPYYLTADQSLSTERPVQATSTIAWAPPQAPGAAATFTTAPVKQAVTLAGPGNAALYATSSATEVQLSARLDDIAPDGTVRGICATSLIGSQRAVDAEKSWYDDDQQLIYAQHPFTQESARPVPVGKVVRYDLELPPRMYTLEPGHRLRLTVQTQAPDMPNSAAGGWQTTAQQNAALAGGSYDLQLGGAKASMLNLPLLEASTFATHKEAEALPTDLVTPGLPTQAAAAPNPSRRPAPRLTGVRYRAGRLRLTLNRAARLWITVSGRRGHRHRTRVLRVYGLTGTNAIRLHLRRKWSYRIVVVARTTDGGSARRAIRARVSAPSAR